MPWRLARKSAQLSQLWQFPLLVVSLSLFGVAAYLFINPHSKKITIDDKIAVARAYLTHERPDAASSNNSTALSRPK